MQILMDTTEEPNQPLVSLMFNLTWPTLSSEGNWGLADLRMNYEHGKNKNVGRILILFIK